MLTFCCALDRNFDNAEPRSAFPPTCWAVTVAKNDVGGGHGFILVAPHEIAVRVDVTTTRPFYKLVFTLLTLH